MSESAFIASLISLLLGLSMSWIVCRKLYSKQNEDSTALNQHISELKEKLIKSETEKHNIAVEREKIVSEAVSDKYKELAAKEHEIAAVKQEILKLKEEFHNRLVKEIEDVRTRAAAEALKDYQVVCTPFFYYDDGFFKKYARGGYRYRLLVKNIPVFNDAEIVIDERSEFNEEVRTSILGTVDKTLELLGNQLGGLPLQIGPKTEKKMKKK